MRIQECANFDIISSAGTNQGPGVIQGLGGPNFGQVGFGIDPRNKVASAIESNATTTELLEGGSEEGEEASEETQARGLVSSIEAEDQEEVDNNGTTTTAPPKERRRRDVTQIAAYGQQGPRPVRNTGVPQGMNNHQMNNHQMNNDNPEVKAQGSQDRVDEDVAASGDGNSEPVSSLSIS